MAVALEEKARPGRAHFLVEGHQVVNLHSGGAQAVEKCFIALVQDGPVRGIGEDRLGGHGEDDKADSPCVQFPVEVEDGGERIPVSARGRAAAQNDMGAGGRWGEEASSGEVVDVRLVVEFVSPLHDIVRIETHPRPQALDRFPGLPRTCLEEGAIEGTAPPAPE